MVPIFVSPGIAWASVEKLPSEEDLVLMIYNFSAGLAEAGLNLMCCAIKQQKCICFTEEGCMRSGVHCWMERVKERWIESNMPLQKEDYNILQEHIKDL